MTRAIGILPPYAHNMHIEYIKLKMLPKWPATEKTEITKIIHKPARKKKV
jgi:hypothetical protein